jgi:hypothetical protein
MDALPAVDFALKNLATGKYVEIHGHFDQGSDVTNMPTVYAEQLGVDLSREQPIDVETVGNRITGYLVNMEMEFGGMQFNAPVLFRDTSTGPLLGSDPILRNFTVVFEGGKVMFFPASGSQTVLSLKMLALRLATTLGAK